MLAYRDDYVKRLPADRYEAERALEEAIALARVTGDPFLLCQALYARGELLNAYHQWAEAESRHRESLVIARDNDDLHSTMAAVIGLAHVFHNTGRPLESKELYRDTLHRALDALAPGATWPTCSAACTWWPSPKEGRCGRYGCGAPRWP